MRVGTGRRRRNYLINKPLQFKFAFIAVWLMIVAALVAITIVYYTTWDLMLEEMGFSHSPPVHEMIARVNRSLAVRMSLAVTACVFVGLALAVLFLHRIAGPAYRIQRVLQEIARGESPGPVRLRRKDYLKDLAGDLDLVVDSLRQERKMTLSAIEAIKQNADKAREKAQRAGASDVVSELDGVLKGISLIIDNGGQ